MGKEFINKDLDKDTLTLNEVYDLSLMLHEKALKQGLDYYYILVKDGEDIVYAAMSGDTEDITDLPMGGYWLSLKDSEDDSFDETWDAFHRDEPLYIESSDMWGSYRSIYLTETAPDGRKYIAGADIMISSLRSQIFLNSLKVFLPFILALIIMMPPIYYLNKNTRDKERMEKYIETMSIRDKLTGAFRRKYGLGLLSEYIDIYHKSGRLFSICLIDIDNLKFINETRGIEAGDTLIVIVHRLVARIFRQTDSIIRLEGNKLLVILPDFDRRSTRDVYSNLEEKINTFNRLNKKSLFIRLNYTMSQYSSGSMTDFLEQTRVNLRIESSQSSWKNQNLHEEILKGLQSNEFKAYFQPKVYLKTKKVSFEALARWEHPEKGLISPGLFVPIAEKSFLINDITKVILRDSLKLAENLKTNISVNLSLVSFDNIQFLRELRGILKDSSYAKYITFEITESVAIKDINSTLKKMKVLKEAGITFAIDDFGSGYSSLPFIDILPIEEIKIDRSFINDINTSKINEVIIEFVNRIASVKKFNVVCEGTEEEQQIRKLMKLGNFSFQGYYFGRPEPFDTVIKKSMDRSYLKKMEEFI